MEYHREPSKCEGVGTTGHGAEEDHGMGETESNVPVAQLTKEGQKQTPETTD